MQYKNISIKGDHMKARREPALHLAQQLLIKLKEREYDNCLSHSEDAKGDRGMVEAALLYFVGYENHRLGKEEVAHGCYHNAANIGSTHKHHFLPAYAALLIGLDPYNNSPNTSPIPSPSPTSAGSPNTRKSSPNRGKRAAGSPKKTQQETAIDREATRTLPWEREQRGCGVMIRRCVSAGDGALAG